MPTIIKRIVGGLGGLLMLAYVIYHIFTANYTPMKTVSATAYSVYETVTAKAIAIRDEQLIQDTSKGGHLYYTIQNGSRVSQKGTIADIYSDANVALIKEQLNELDQEIAGLEQAQLMGNVQQKNLDALQKQIAIETQRLSYAASMADLSELSKIRYELLGLMNQQQITIGKVDNFSDRLQELKNRRSQLASQYKGSSGSIKSPISGYFINQVDGFETQLTTQDALSLSVADIQQLLDSQPQPPTGYVGKVAKEFHWYIACVVPIEKTAGLEEGKSLEVTFPFVSGDPVPVKVTAIHQDPSGQVALILQCNQMSKELAGIRIEQMQIRIKEHTGLRVPAEALRFNSQQQPGVYIQRGNVVRFRLVEILYNNDTDGYVICKADSQQTKGSDTQQYLKEFDDIIVGGKDLYDGKMIG